MGLDRRLSPQATRELDTVFQLPGWVLGWFFVTAAVCTWDASFIVLRPLTLPGGKLFPFWSPYSLYIGVDQRYQDVNDPFVYGISLFNYLEVVLNVVTIIMHFKRSRHTIPLAFTVTVMTFWKTLFYFYGFTEMGGGAAFRVGNTAWEEFLLVVIPNGVWVIIPGFVIAALWSRMLPVPEQEGSGGVRLTSDNGEFSSSASVNNKTHMRSFVEHAKRA